VISDFGLWKAFVTTHKNLYGRYLPFYEVDEANYCTDEINLYDIQLLLWMNGQIRVKGRVLNPENPYLADLAQQIYDYLDSKFEQAPVNTWMLDEFYGQDWTSDFYKAKFLCTLLSTSFYLQDEAKHGARYDMIRTAVAQVLFPEGNLDRKDVNYATAAIVSLTARTGALQLLPAEWASCLFANRGMEKEARYFAGIRSLKIQIFQLNTFDAHTITLEDIKGELSLVSLNNS
jgi:hypothetical protein